MIHIACFRDAYFYSDALIKLIDDKQNFIIDFVSSSLADLLFKIRHQHIDLILMLHEDDSDSIKQLINGIKIAFATLPIVYIQPDRDVQKAKLIEKLGVSVYLYKMSALSLIDSLHSIAEKYSRSEHSTSIFLPEQDFKLTSGLPSSPFSLLSSHQKKIICLLSEGIERHQIAARNNLSIHTINKYVQMAKEKCGCQTTNELLTMCANDIRVLNSKKEILNILPNDKSNKIDKGKIATGMII
jgi:DNA-binding NarL/FixJ family response regulator